tara:strand:+ start:1090 stop:1875 length:786 start_codon:yes stop_codon:yes gene_type:complete
MTSVSHPFFAQNNLELLWGLISTEYQLSNDKITNATPSKTLQIYTTGIQDIYDANIMAFKSKIITNESLIVLNKTFLSQVNSTVNNVFPDFREYLKKGKIKIIDNDNNHNHNHILHEDIQSHRQKEFNQRVEHERQQLNYAMEAPWPPENIDLSDKTPADDRNPQTIAEQYARTMAERNYDPIPSNQVRKNSSTTTTNKVKNTTFNENENIVYETTLDNNSMELDNVIDADVKSKDDDVMEMLKIILGEIKLIKETLKIQT